MVPAYSVRIPRVPTYSVYPLINLFAYKTFTFYRAAFQLTSAKVYFDYDTGIVLLQFLRAPPFSLATTRGIVFTFFSSGY